MSIDFYRVMRDQALACGDVKGVESADRSIAMCNWAPEEWETDRPVNLRGLLGWLPEDCWGERPDLELRVHWHANMVAVAPGWHWSIVNDVA